jgi:lipopolysaccharide biosynthesis protein
MKNHLLKLIAFYLPQFHPIPENDQWWGKGFTEWNNVIKGKPLFPGHYQPHLPADLGFYDLRLPEIREAQVTLARENGIYGFCYYHYWFHGQRLLERPFNDCLTSDKPAFPFCLCWANETWRRNWDGHSGTVLIEQTYSLEDDKKHIRWLCDKVFCDARYIRIKEKPLFLIYRASLLPNLPQTIDLWREEALRLGIGEIYLCRVESFPDETGDPRKYGFDAAVEFQPEWRIFGKALYQGKPKRFLSKLGFIPKAYFDHKVYDYNEIVERMLKKSKPNYKIFPCVFPSFDNSVRRKQDALIIINSTPEKYQYWIQKILAKYKISDTEENILFINAWNEWAEGNHLEPCQKWGTKYLEATKNALENFYDKIV